MSLSINQTNVVVAVDPRIDVRGADSSSKYVIHKGAALYSTKRIPANSFSNSSINWNAPPPSERVFIDKKIRVSIPLRLTFVGTGTGGGNLLEYGINDALRFSPLNNCLFSSVQISINNATVSQNMSDTFEPLMRYQNYSQAMDGYSGTPSMMDQSQQYSDVFGGNRNPLGSYNDGLDQAQTPRGGFSDVKIVSNTHTGAVVDCLLTEYIFISPLAFNLEDETGFIGINQFEVVANINNGNELSRVWSHNAVNGGNITSVTVDIAPSGGTYGTSPELHFQYLTPRQTDVIPHEMSYPYYNLERYPNPIGLLPLNVRTNVMSSNIQVNSIPRRVYIWARKSNGVRTYNDCDAYPRIDSVNINWDNLSGQLSNADSRDLYEISRRNGLNMSYPQWQCRYDLNDATSGKLGCGSVLCIDFARDIGLQPAQAPGLLGNFQFQCNVDFTNLTDPGVATYTMYVAMVFEGQFSVKDGNTYTQLGVVDPSNLLKDVKLLPEADYDRFMQSATFYGGSVFQKIKSALKTAAKIAIPIGKVAAVATGNPELLPLLELANKFIGKGMSEDEAIKKAMEKLGKGRSGGGISGGVIEPSLAGEGLVGGKPMSRKKLTKRLV